MIPTLEDNLAEYSRDTTNKMQAITTGSKSSSTLSLEDWISDVLWCKTPGAKTWMEMYPTEMKTKIGQ
ncbi:unnamed protein product [Absidia cylindrospora]